METFAALRLGGIVVDGETGSLKKKKKEETIGSLIHL